MAILSISQAPPLSAAAEPPLLRCQGELDGKRYLALVAAAERMHAAGATRLRIDLSQVTGISPAGLVALFAIAELFDERPLPDFDDGWGTIRQMLDWPPRPRYGPPAVDLVGVPEAVGAAIARAGLLPRFGGPAPSAAADRHRPAA